MAGRTAYIALGVSLVLNLLVVAGVVTMAIEVPSIREVATAPATVRRGLVVVGEVVSHHCRLGSGHADRFRARRGCALEEAAYTPLVRFTGSDGIKYRVTSNMTVEPVDGWIRRGFWGGIAFAWEGAVCIAIWVAIGTVLGFFILGVQTFIAG